MSSIMKGIVDEGDWTGGIINWKKEVTSKHGPDVTFKKRKLPGVNGKTDTYATNSEGKVVGVYQHHNDMGRVLSETDAIKGADGKRCWKGKRYAGTENGKDKCIPVKEESDEEALERLKKNKSREKWEADADLEYMRNRHAKKKKDETNEGSERVIVQRPGRTTIVDKSMQPTPMARAAMGALAQHYQSELDDLNKKREARRRGDIDEGVIVGHDANDPEIAILGGAGTMSLSRLKKKAHQEALQLADDIANGKYNASSYNMKQLHNTLNTIVAAEKEMEKSYFGENAWNQLGQRKPNTNLPAPERGSRVNHGRRFEEGDIVLPLSGPLKGQPHKVIHSQRTVIRIVPLTGTYPGDTIAPRTKHEWVVPADINEDYTGEFAAEKTPAVNPHCGQKDLQFRGAISETPTDNPTGTSTEGGWRNYKPKSAGTHNESSILKGLKRESK